MAFPQLLPSHIWAADAKPNSRLTMGYIGMGTQSRGLLRNFLGHHLMNLAYAHQTKIGWNPEKLIFTEGSGDPKWLTRDYLGPWKV